MTATGTGGELWHAPSWRGKNASPAADRRHTFTFPADSNAVAVWRASVAFLPTSLIAPARGTCRRHPRCPLPAMQACRVGGACANATAPRSRKSGGASLPRRVPSSAFWLRRNISGAFSRVTDVVARQQLLDARRQGSSGSRFPACSAGDVLTGRNAWPSSRRADHDLATSARAGARREWCSRTTP